MEMGTNFTLGHYYDKKHGIMNSPLFYSIDRCVMTTQNSKSI